RETRERNRQYRLVGLRLRAGLPPAALERSERLHSGEPPPAGCSFRIRGQGEGRQRGRDAGQAAGQGRGAHAAYDPSRGTEQSLGTTESGTLRPPRAAGEERGHQRNGNGSQIREREMRAASKSRGVSKILVRPALWFCACNVLAAALAAQCTNPTQVPNGTYTSGDHSQVDNNALSAANVALSGSATATFVAGNCIQLLPGFHASAIGATVPTTFHAWVETAPAAVSGSPSSGTGLSQPFTWTVSSPSGYSNVSDLYALFNTSVSGANACYIHYIRGSNLLFLADNTGANWLAGFVPGSSGSAGNSSCTIYGSGSSFSTSGTQLAVTVSVAFQTSFAGTKNEYLIGYDNEGLNTAWQQMGTWTVPAPQQYYLTTTVSPSGGGTISPSCPGGCAYNANAVVQISANAASGYTFSGFTGALSGTATPQFLTMNGPKSVTANFAGAQTTVTVQTSPPNLQVTIGGVYQNTPYYWTCGSGSITVGVPSPQSGGAGTRYLYGSWSDSGAQTHAINCPASSATYTASF